VPWAKAIAGRQSSAAEVLVWIAAEALMDVLLLWREMIV